jgi:hypothetical protein
LADSKKSDSDNEKRFLTGEFAVSCINICQASIQKNTRDPYPAILLAPNAQPHFSEAVRQLNINLNTRKALLPTSHHEEIIHSEINHANIAEKAIEDFALLDASEMTTELDQAIHTHSQKWLTSLIRIRKQDTPRAARDVAVNEAKKQKIPFAPAQG